MRPLREVVLSAVGICSPLGSAPEAARALAEGRGALSLLPALSALPSALGAPVEGPDLKSWLKRRKDSKLLARPAQLALAAAGEALRGYTGDRGALGLFLGVGREPPDSGESEPCLVASCRDGALDEALLAGVGRDLYPPLLPLQTLPNMALAHVSINMDILGENGAWAGGIGASWAALCSAWWCVAEGRTLAALAGGADSLIDLGSARDRLRMGATLPPGEAAAWILLEEAGEAARRGAATLARVTLLDAPSAAGASNGDAVALRGLVGDTGAAEGALRVALAALRGDRRPADLAGAEPGFAPMGLALR